MHIDCLAEEFSYWIYLSDSGLCISKLSFKHLFIQCTHLQNSAAAPVITIMITIFLFMTAIISKNSKKLSLLEFFIYTLKQHIFLRTISIILPNSSWTVNNRNIHKNTSFYAQPLNNGLVNFEDLALIGQQPIHRNSYNFILLPL